MKSLVMAYLALALLAATVCAANDKNYTYLALGDSIPFGMNATLVPPYSYQTPTASQFVGYPEVVEAVEFLLGSKKEVNASCPGESSGSFLDTSVVDNGCNSPHFQPPAPTIPPFKTTYGLHTAYTGSQMVFAESQLKTNKSINLVTLSIGANDILLALPLLEQCGTSTTCAQSVLAPVLQTYAANLAQILSRIRAQYRGTLILVKYYSPASALDSVTTALNDVMAQVATQPVFSPVIVADGFTAFQRASAPFNHDVCQAGLLIRLPSTSSTPTCDIHPSPFGRDLLAATVELAKLGKH